jgi:hypothetical protein
VTKKKSFMSPWQPSNLQSSTEKAPVKIQTIKVGSGVFAKKRRFFVTEVKAK